MSDFETFLLLAAGAVSAIVLLNAIGWLINRIRDKMDPRRTQPVVFDRYKQDRVYDQDAE